jgi:hypothetical protein
VVLLTLYLDGRRGLLEVGNGALTGFAPSELTAARVAEPQANLTGELADGSPSLAPARTASVE